MSATAAQAVAPLPARRTSAHGGAWLLTMLLLGVMVRVFHVSRSDFPLGDGGLFLAIVEQLHRAGWALPHAVSYNGEAIPFGYPPFGFYVAAAASLVTGATPLDVTRVLPLAWSMVTLAAFAGLARSVLGVGTRATAAVFAFGVLPLAYRYFIMGAGITRSPGLAFAILTIWLVYLVSQRRQRWAVPLAAAAGALTVLSHPNAAWFAAYSSGLVVLFFARRRDALTDVGIVAAGVIAVTAPWWLTVVGRHGVEPFLAASQSSNPGIPATVLLLSVRLTEEPIAPILGMAAIVGVIVCARSRDYWLPAWLLAGCVLDTRYSGTFAMVPLALLAGVGIEGIVTLAAADVRQGEVGKFARGVIGGTLAWLAALSLLGSVLAPGPALQALPTEHRLAMSWIAEATPKDSAFLIVAPAGQSAGSESEWFPLLADRRSLGSYQGSEWIEQATSASPWQRYNELQSCGAHHADCLETWATASGTFDYVYLRDLGTERLRDSLAGTLNYTLAYRGVDVSIYRRSPQ